MPTLVKADNKMREQETRAAIMAGVLKPKVQIPITMPDCAGAARKLRLNAMPQNLLDGDSDRSDQYWVVWTFLKALDVRPCVHNAPGVTWLKLLALFELLGATIDLTSKHMRNKAASRCSLRTLLIYFKKLVGTIAEASLHVGELQLF